MSRYVRALLSRNVTKTIFPGLAAAHAANKYAARLRPTRCASDDARAAKKADEAFWLSGGSAGSDELMASKYDLYGGVIVDPKCVPPEPDIFRETLSNSIVTWTNDNKRGVWLQIGIEQAALIPIATAEFGFEFHHAERGHVMLTKWLPKDVPNTLPMNASHTIGVGCVVTDADGRLLLVQEKSGPAARLGIWKLPTGLVDAGEEIQDAALREVKEETGVDASFEFLGSFVMNHGGNLAHAGKSNVFFIVKCRANSTQVRAQDSEIAEAKWFTFEEYEKLPFPEKGSLWDQLNKSVLTGSARLEAEPVALGNNRPGHRWMYSPSPKPALPYGRL